MAKRQPSGSRQRVSKAASPPSNPLDTQLQALVRQHKYRQALDEIQKARRSHPDLITNPSEADIWLLRGQFDFERGEIKTAESSFRRSLDLGLQGAPHYWLARTLLSLNRLDAALDFIGQAFEQGSLPKEYTICYAKLLLLKGNIDRVKELVNQQAKRFPAAHLHWLQGVLDLKAGAPEEALESFKKVKRGITPGDRPDVWSIYALQAAGNWEGASLRLGLGLPSSGLWGMQLGPSTYANHPLLLRLALLQAAKTGHPSPEDIRMPASDRQSLELLYVLSLVQLIQNKNPHDAAHALLKLDRRSSRFPELVDLRPALLVQAGEQAMVQGEMGCAAEFWQLSLKEQSFNPQLAVNLMKVLDGNEDYQELQRLITQIVRWIEQDVKKHPDAWPEARRKSALSYAHCRLADTHMVLGRQREAMGDLQTAERIDPRSPEVKGRRGIIAFLEDRYEDAVTLLTAALEEGCRYSEVYQKLLEVLEELDRMETALEVRCRFGKRFGDLNPELDVVVPAWVEALSSQRYVIYRQIIKTTKSKAPEVQACRILIESAQGEPTSSGKISLNQTRATEQWEKLLKGLSPEEQVTVVQAIALSILLFAKREKGIAALIKQYLDQLLTLSQTIPAANEAYLVTLIVKERDGSKVRTPVQNYLNTVPQPGNTLAQIQLQMRRFAQLIALRSLIDDYLQREPQNPLLLLAKATTYPSTTRDYERIKQQGFEIARRLQNARALQAFREEDAFQESRLVDDVMPDLADMEDLDMGDLDDILERMIRKMLGNQLPPSELKQALPELKRMMMNSMPPDLMDDDDEGPNFGFPLPFPGEPSFGKRKRK